MAILKNLTIDDTGFLSIPSGTIAQRPSPPSAGMFRYNSEYKLNEFYNGTEWVNTTQVPIVTSNLSVYLDASESASYPGSGTTWTDLSGNGNNATLVNGVGYNSGNGGSLVFDGSDDSITIANSLSLQNTLSLNSFSITTVSKSIDFTTSPKSLHPFWMETYVLNGTWAIANRGMSSADGGNGPSSYAIEVNNGGTYFVGSVNHNAVTSTIYHRTIVIDRTNGFTFKYYVNGIFLGETGSTSITGSIYTSGGMSFGNMWGWVFNGNLYSLYLHSKALTASEISQNFSAVKWRFGL
jgi:hypothetical protein